MAQYFFKVSNAPDVGPISADEFQQRLVAGEIKDGTMVWRSGMGDWSTYAALCAAGQRAASAAPVASPAPASPRKAQTSPALASPKPAFLTCGSCGLEWPESLLFPEGAQRICGNCLNRQKEGANKGRKMPGVGTSLTAWFFIALSIVSAVCMSYKITHPGPPVPKERAKELTAPATYGK